MYRLFCCAHVTQRAYIFSPANHPSIQRSSLSLPHPDFFAHLIYTEGNKTEEEEEEEKEGKCCWTFAVRTYPTSRLYSSAAAATLVSLPTHYIKQESASQEPLHLFIYIFFLFYIFFFSFLFVFPAAGLLCHVLFYLRSNAHVLGIQRRTTKTQRIVQFDPPICASDGFLFICVYYSIVYTLFCCVYMWTNGDDDAPTTSIICAMAFHDGRQYRRLSYLRLQSSPHHSNPLFYFISFFVPLRKQGNFSSLSFVSSAAGWSSSSSLVFVQQQQHKSAGNEERANGWTLSFRFLFEYVMVEREKERGGGIVVGACFFT